MAHPKRRQSKSRRDKRRTHYVATAPQLMKDTATGEIHKMHHAYWHEDKLYYRGRVVIDKSIQIEE